MTVSIQALPPEARPRERLLQGGPGVLSDAELLALVLGSGRPGASAIEVAGELLALFGSLKEAARARPDELTRVGSVGRAKAAGLMAAFELGRRAEARDLTGPRLNGPMDIARCVVPHLSDPGSEEVFVLALSAGNRVRRVERVAIGSESACSVEIRSILGVALRLGVPALALVHTHPSGDPAPSSADVALTASLHRAADGMGIRLVDHVILAGARWASVLSTDPDVRERAVSHDMAAGGTVRPALRCGYGVVGGGDRGVWQSHRNGTRSLSARFEIS